ncbi:MAG: peptidase M15 [Bacteroidaceae bacterium]|nr:peptidase M15 [Bacteroidaceae bacterium]
MKTSDFTEKAETFPPWGDKRGASYFTISELTSSATAQREGIDNRPPTSAYHLLHVLVEQLLDPIREAWGAPILVSSGYRCKELNELVGGAKNSHHLLGCAADLIAGSKAEHLKLFNLIRQMQQAGKIRFTQLIWEGDGRWIHISYVPSDLRCQVIE